MQALNQIHNCEGVEFVEIAGGFIGQQHSRLGHERPRNRHALLLSSGQFRRSVLRTSSQPNFSEPFIGPLERLGVSDVVERDQGVSGLGGDAEKGKKGESVSDRGRKSHWRGRGGSGYRTRHA